MSHGGHDRLLTDFRRKRMTSLSRLSSTLDLHCYVTMWVRHDSLVTCVRHDSFIEDSWLCFKSLSRLTQGKSFSLVRHDVCETWLTRYMCETWLIHRRIVTLFQVIESIDSREVILFGTSRCVRDMTHSLHVWDMTHSLANRDSGG